MGQKINPQSLRIGITKDWTSRWFFSSMPTNKGTSTLSRKQLYAKFLEEDVAIRKTVYKKIGTAGVAGVIIERTPNDVKIFIKAARPGLVIGRGGKGIEELTGELEKVLKRIRGDMGKTRLSVNVEELKRTEASAAYIAQQIAWDLERRMPYRRTIKKYLDQLSQSRDVKGAKVYLSGRLGGAEIARREMLKFGPLPLQTLRADIDYGTATAFTTYGTIGVKAWIYKGQIVERRRKPEDKNER